MKYARAQLARFFSVKPLENLLQVPSAASLFLSQHLLHALLRFWIDRDQRGLSSASCRRTASRCWRTISPRNRASGTFWTRTSGSSWRTPSTPRSCRRIPPPRIARAACPPTWRGCCGSSRRAARRGDRCAATRGRPSISTRLCVPAARGPCSADRSSSSLCRFSPTSLHSDRF